MATRSARHPTSGVTSTKTRGWVPILDGSAAAKAWEAIHDIALALQHPHLIRGPEYCLIEGLAGRALFYGYLGMATEADDAAGRAFDLMERSVDGVMKGPAGAGLMFGFPGVAWVVEHLGGRICETDPDDDVNGGIDEAVMEIFSAAPDGEWWQGGHDVMYGLAGLGVYALERLPRTSARRMLHRILDKLEATSERRPEGISWPSPTETIPAELRGEYPDGVFSLGVAHGSPGVIGFLGRLYATDIERPRVWKLLTSAVAWLLAHKLSDGGGSSFGHWSGNRTPARSSWCYGNLGIAPCLMTAGRTTGENGWENVALELALEAADRPIEDSGVIDASICHGAVGVAHLLNRVYQASGDQRLREAAGFWFAKTLEMRRPNEGLAGFMTYRQDDPDDKPIWKTDAGLLTGVTGVGLALLSALTPLEPEWDRIFLAAIPSSSGT